MLIYDYSTIIVITSCLKIYYKHLSFIDDYCISDVLLVSLYFSGVLAIWGYDYEYNGNINSKNSN